MSISKCHQTSIMILYIFVTRFYPCTGVYSFIIIYLIIHLMYQKVITCMVLLYSDTFYVKHVMLYFDVIYNSAYLLLSN